MAREKTRAGKHLSELMMKAYMDIHARAADGAFVVWTAIIVPPEIFRGFDNVVCCVPESHAALCAGKGVGADQCLKAEALGYSMDLCSYARIDIGALSDGYKESPTFGMPKPGLLVSDSNNCSLLVKWFDVHRRALDVPHFILDVPFCYEAQREKDLGYVLSQLEGLIGTVERLSGQKFDEGKFREAAELTGEAVRQWKRFLEFAKHRPSGITVFDSFVQMAPLFTSRGTPDLVEHYTLLADEVEERVGEGKFPVPDERYRLMWDNIAPWHHLRKLSERLAAAGANIVAAPYTSCIGSLEGTFEPFDMESGAGSAADALWYLARCQNHSVCPMGMDLRLKAMGEAIEGIGIDGVVFASNRSCKVFSVMQMDEQRIIGERYGIPSVMIDVDHADVRKFSEESVYLRLDALLERIEAERCGR
ncbi:MAG: 2-hydroxyacyl-CoA dehydratase subunit D [Candidatus Geothermincolia bacterium]